ncbi:hypothetical protein CYMTET_17080 [Cymbomonas tetramitiformis]|uniref:TRP C-terminal domain-containing protein n=1 Tax=Cymbomonas tetramitiformis TaxID=36881 RepID=A0AAE0GAU1_9CHLO|nr:hypothetical protein CYMTET_17080 [Cymbomonas tetramitiformis]
MTWTACHVTSSRVTTRARSVPAPDQRPLMITSGVVEGRVHGGAGGRGTARAAGLDWYGHVVRAYDLWVVVNKAEEDDEATLSELDNNLQVYNGTQGAVFDDLQLTARPGRVHRLVFLATSMAGSELWGNVSVDLQLEACAAGQTYSAGEQTCISCAAGSIRFDNGSDPCSECVAGLDCIGGNEFVVEDGYWMAVDSASEACDGDDVQCTFDRVYECQVAAACASQVRAGRQAEEVELLEQDSLCRTGYATGVVLCGACAEGYEVGEASTCVACPPLWAAILRISCILLTLLVMLVLVMRLVQKVSLTQESLVQAIDTTDDTASMATITKGTYGIIIGWMQVAAQSLFIYDADCIPELYGKFLGMINVFNFPIMEWLAVSCLMDELQTAGVPMPDGGFYFNFYFRAALPFIIAWPMFMVGSVKPVDIIRVILGKTARLADLPPVTPGQEMPRSTTSSKLGHGREPPTHERSEDLSPDDLVRPPSSGLARLPCSDIEKPAFSSSEHRPGVDPKNSPSSCPEVLLSCDSYKPPSEDTKMWPCNGRENPSADRSFQSFQSFQSCQSFPSFPSSRSLPLNDIECPPSDGSEDPSFNAPNSTPADGSESPPSHPPDDPPSHSSKKSPSSVAENPESNGSEELSSSVAENPMPNGSEELSSSAAENPESNGSEELSSSVAENPMPNGSEELSSSVAENPESNVPRSAESNGSESLPSSHPKPLSPNAMESPPHNAREDQVSIGSEDPPSKVSVVPPSNGSEDPLSKIGMIPPPNAPVFSPANILEMCHDGTQGEIRVRGLPLGTRIASLSMDADEGYSKRGHAVDQDVAAAVADNTADSLQLEDDCSPASPMQSAAKPCGEEELERGAEAESVEDETVEGETVGGEPVEGAGRKGSLAPLFENSRIWYPPIAIFLLIFLHPTCGTQMFHVFNCTPVHLHHVDAQQWLELDLRVECFTWQWTLCASVAAFVILTYILGLPIILAMIVWRLRSYRRVALPGGEVLFAPKGWMDGAGEGEGGDGAGEGEGGDSAGEGEGGDGTGVVEGGNGAGEGLDSDAPLPKVADKEEEERTLLDHRRVRGSLGVLYAPFKRRFFWFTSYDMVRRLVQTSAVLVVRLINPDLDLYYALLVSVVFLALQAHLSPYDDADDNLVQMLVLLNHCVVLLTLLYTRDSGHGTSGADVVLVGTQVALSMYILRVLIRQYPHLWGYLFKCLAAILRQAGSLWRRVCHGCQKGGTSAERSEAKQGTKLEWWSNLLSDDPSNVCTGN